MPTPVVRPSNYPIPFANSGQKNTIPTTGNGVSAGFDTGFPPVTMQPITAGGVPPQGKDFNGILYDVTTHTVWVNAGGQYQFDAALSTAIGGYPAGMVLQSNDGLKSYVSAVNNNTTDFNSTPSSIGSAWLPWAGGGAVSNVNVATTGGTTVLTAIQAQSRMITVTGVLTSNATLTFPAALGRWTIVNNTTGGFSVNAIALGGAGVPILQGAADTVYCDATNIKYANASAVTQPVSDNSKAIATTEFVKNVSSSSTSDDFVYFMGQN
jgi:hypothetical protein